MKKINFKNIINQLVEDECKIAFNELKINNKKELIKVLNKYNVNIDSWGTGNTKTVDHLMKEIKEKETTMFVEKNKLIRMVSVAIVNVKYKELTLKEDKQVFSDGRIRNRNNKGSVSEKMKFNENHLKAAERAIREELQIKGELNIKSKGNEVISQDSQSYPSLFAKINFYMFELELDDSQFNADGYKEQQDNLTTHFIWK